MACRLLEVSPGGYHRFLKAPFATRKVRRLAILERIEVWCQLTRLHLSLGYISPRACESAARAG
jgi:hypothetical protein